MKKIVYGSTTGLRNTQIKRIEALYTLKSSPQFILAPEIAMELVEISHDIRRQIGLMIDRNGKIICVIAGEPQRIVIPVTSDHMASPGRLKGLRCIHTHLTDEPLTRDDLTDLAQIDPADIALAETFNIDEVECDRCGACAAICKFDAVTIS